MTPWVGLTVTTRKYLRISNPKLPEGQVENYPFYECFNVYFGCICDEGSLFLRGMATVIQGLEQKEFLKMLLSYVDY